MYLLLTFSFLEALDLVQALVPGHENACFTTFPHAVELSCLRWHSCGEPVEQFLAFS